MLVLVVGVLIVVGFRCLLLQVLVIRVLTVAGIDCRGVDCCWC